MSGDNGQQLGSLAVFLVVSVSLWMVSRRAKADL